MRDWNREKCADCGEWMDRRIGCERCHPKTDWDPVLDEPVGLCVSCGAPIRPRPGQLRCDRCKLRTER